MFSVTVKLIMLTLPPFVVLTMFHFVQQLTADTYEDAVARLSEVIVGTEDAEIEQNMAVLETVANYFNQLATFVTGTNVTINATVSCTFQNN